MCAFGNWGHYPAYVSVAERRAKAAREMARLRKSGKVIQPVEIAGRNIATTFWGQAWCDHIEILSDFASRLDRGKRYARNGSIAHLEIAKGKIQAVVSGSELYEIRVEIQPLKSTQWKKIKQACAGQIGSVVELLQGKFSDATMKILTDADAGMFPAADDFDLDCNCPDFARLCKHLAAVLYGVGARLDRDPELLFLLRGVDPTELLTESANLRTKKQSQSKTLAGSEFADVFGIEMDESAVAAKPKPARKAKKPPAKPKAKAKARPAAKSTQKIAKPKAPAGRKK